MPSSKPPGEPAEGHAPLTLGPTPHDATLQAHAAKCVVLMPSFGKCAYRAANQAAVTKWYAARNIPVVLGTDTRSRTGYFSRARAINNAARETHETHPDRNIYLLADNDLTPSVPHLVAAIEALPDHSAVTPHQYTLHTTLLGRDQLLKGQHTFLYRTYEIGSRSYVVITRQSFEAMNGMDELFEGWGPEDAAFLASVRKQLGPVLHMDGSRTHLWHPMDTSKRNRKQLLANRARYKRYQQSDQAEATLLARQYGSFQR